MRNPQGYAIVVDPEGPPKEADTVTCSHCQRLVFVGGYVDPTELGGFCRMCMKHICGPCADKGACVPFEKKLEEFERKARFHQAVGTILGSIVLFFFLSASAFSADLYISWTDASSDEDSFEIYRATSINGTYSLIATTAANVTSYRDGPLLTGLQLYCYKIRACNGGVCSAYLGPICATARQLPGSGQFQ